MHAPSPDALVLLLFAPPEDAPAQNFAQDGTGPRYLDLAHATLTLWVRESDETRLRELRDLCVVSAVFLLGLRRDTLVGADAAGEARTLASGVGDARLETLSQLGGLVVFPSPVP